MPFLELKNVSKAFGLGAKRRPVLSDLNLAVEKGEFVALVGYSGCGKSTLISLIAGLLPPDAGSIRIGGREITGPDRTRGIVFQNYSLLPWLSVYENVRLAVDETFSELTREQRDAHTRRYIEMVNLTRATDKFPRELSGGMRQRVSVARALSMQPEVLLLDEPLSALDALTRAILQDEIRRIWEAERRTVILITNDLDEGLLLADRIIPMAAGPPTSLGPEVRVEIARPRERKTLHQHPAYLPTRNQLLTFLTGKGAPQKTVVSRKLCLPAIEPEDLWRPRPIADRRRGPVRSQEVKRESLELSS
jgi:nitrate/nitrite transport system ATP-binding protein